MTIIAMLAAHLLIGPVLQVPETVEGVVEAMIERYVGMWYRDITFVQTTSYYDADEREVHPLLLMGFDAYFMTVEEVLTKLDGLGVDLDKMHESR